MNKDDEDDDNDDVVDDDDDMRCLSFFYLFVHVKRSLKVVSTDYGRRLDFEQTHAGRGSLSVLMPNVARCCEHL